MTQSDWGVMDPYVETGVELADHLNEFRDALHSLHRGATRPAYAVPGTLWIDDSGGPGAWKLMIHLSGAGGDRLIATFDTATAGFPTTIDVSVLRAATHYADAGQYRWAYPLNTTNLRNWSSYVDASGQLVFARMNDAFSAELASFKLGTDGKIVGGQTASLVTAAVGTGTTIMPDDDTIPQSGEGDQFMTLAITPKSVTSTLVIEVNAILSSSNNNITLSMALFKDSETNARAAVAQYMGYGIANGVMHTVDLRYTMVSGATTAMTFKVRAGGSVAGTTTFNGANAARKFGGAAASSIVISEVL